MHGRGWHTAGMTATPAPDPAVNDVRVDSAGDLQYFDGTEWVRYLEVTDIELKPNVVTRVDSD